VKPKASDVDLGRLDSTLREEWRFLPEDVPVKESA
jgi:hypothetical protein